MGTSRLALKVNEMLDEFRVQILGIHSKLLAEDYAANAAQIKQRYLNPTCNTMMLIAGLTDYAKQRQGKVGVRITQRTADKYERLLRYLKQYLARRSKTQTTGLTWAEYARTARAARGDESASFEARRPHRPRLFGTGRRTARQPADGRNRRGVSLRHGHPKHAVHHRPPPRP